MRHIPAVVIGAGQAGLAMSYCLGRGGIDHVVLERGQVGERWRSERWDLLQLLTPNWMSRLPGWSYRGGDPDGFMAAPHFVRYLSDYADKAGAPIEAATAVLSVRAAPSGYRVETSRGAWHCNAVVIATGDCDVPNVPTMARGLPPGLCQLTPSSYRNPDQLPDGGVLVVGASATGVQLAEEIQRSGRNVVLSAGRHTRVPRRYRGRDIWWWLERAGVLDETPAEISEQRRARSQPSFQLVGGVQADTIDLGSLHHAGVRIVGRSVGADGETLHLQDDLAETVQYAQAALGRLLARIDIVADADGAAPKTGAMRTFTFGPSPTRLDLRAEGIRTVLWATGYRRDYSWLKVPVLDERGEIMHLGGITTSPGLYVLGLRFQRRRRSNFIDGVGLDAEELAGHLHKVLARSACVAA